MGNNLSGCLRAHQQIDLAAGETPKRHVIAGEKPDGRAISQSDLTAASSSATINESRHGLSKAWSGLMRSSAILRMPAIALRSADSKILIRSGSAAACMSFSNLHRA
jgi:hypothetical protein